LPISPLGWIVFAAVQALWIAPCWKLLERAGYRGAWALLAVLPPVVLIILWRLAFAPWPAEESDLRS
jgi:hypothetical protein